MSRRDIDEHLLALRVELERVSGGDALDPDRLRELLEAVEARLEESEEPEPPEGLLDGLRQWAASLEVEHPRLASLLNRVLVSLGNAGI